jgi:hypothetical protein
MADSKKSNTPVKFDALKRLAEQKARAHKDAPPAPIAEDLAEVWEGTPEPPGLDGVTMAGPVVEDILDIHDGWPPLPCLAGPCKYYVEIGQVMGVIETMEHRKLYRYCTALLEDPGTMPLGELTIRTCSKFTPPLYSLEGWKQRVAMAPLQRRAAIKSDCRPPIRVRLMYAIGKMLGEHAPRADWYEETAND